MEDYSKKYDFCAIDFETDTDDLISACSIGIVAVKNGEIKEEFYSLINPNVEEFHNSNIRIHGITKDDVKDAPVFNDVANNITYFIDNSEYVVAHNVHFDMSVLYKSFEKIDSPISNFVYFDSMVFCNVLYQGMSKSLKEMCAFYNVNIDHHHNALSDARACANIVIESQNKARMNIDKYLLISNIPIYYFFDLNPQNKFIKHFSSNNIPKSMEAVFDESKSDHPFYNKNVVITGEFATHDRTEMMNMISQVGGTVKSGVSKNINYLIVGQQDKSIVGEDGLSGKQEKAIELISKGVQIIIINESEFLDFFK